MKLELKIKFHLLSGVKLSLMISHIWLLGTLQTLIIIPPILK